MVNMSVSISHMPAFIPLFEYFGAFDSVLLVGLLRNFFFFFGKVDFESAQAISTENCSIYKLLVE